MGVIYMKYNVTVNGNKYEVEVQEENSEVAASESEVKVQERMEAPSINTDNIEGQIISAPMPGKIIAVKTSVGAKVKKDQVILVLEAMKMENEIMAPVDGIISNIFIDKNTTVNAGDKLVAIK